MMIYPRGVLSQAKANNVKTKLQRIPKSPWFIAILAFVLGILLIMVIRFASYQPEEKVHYHANFAVYINGQRELFASPSYYEETSASECNLEEHEESPLERAHLHGNVNDVVHVEDHLVTWGHLLQNLGWAADSMHIKTRDKVLLAQGSDKITFILNGKQVSDINQLVIASKDKLLVNFGSASQENLDDYYQSIASTAGKYNVTPDPASCGAGGSDPSLTDRLKNLL